jgi:ssDNA-binding replication factor A large subunit
MVSEVLDNTQAIIDKIVGSGKMTQAELESQIKEKQEEYGGLLTEAGAAYSIARDMGIDLGIKEDERHATPVSSLKPDLEGVDITGTVTRVFPPKEWKKDTRSGRVASITINDGTGEVRVTLWNNDCDLIDKGSVQQGAKVEIQNASSRERNGITELSVGMRGRVVIKQEAPEASTLKLDKLESGMNDVNAYARVVRVFAPTEFQRETGKGRVATIIVTDGTERRLALWDDNAAWAEKAKAGDVVKVEGAYVKENRGNLELHLGWRGRLLLNPTSAPKLPDVKLGGERVEIRDLGDEGFKEIRATVVRAFPPNVFSVCAKCGARAEGEHCGAPAKAAMVVSAELDDGTGVVRASLFREAAEKLLGFTADDYAKKPKVFKEDKLEGKEYVFVGRVKRNEQFNRIDFVVNAFNDVDAEKEIAILKR